MRGFFLLVSFVGFSSMTFGADIVLKPGESKKLPAGFADSVTCAKADQNQVLVLKGTDVYENPTDDPIGKSSETQEVIKIAVSGDGKYFFVRKLNYVKDDSIKILNIAAVPYENVIYIE